MGLALTNSNNPTPQDESQNSALCTRVCSWQIRWDSETEVTQHVGRPQTCFGKICSYQENVDIALYIFTIRIYFFCKKKVMCFQDVCGFILVVCFFALFFRLWKGVITAMFVEGTFKRLWISIFSHFDQANKANIRSFQVLLKLSRGICKWLGHQLRPQHAMTFVHFWAIRTKKTCLPRLTYTKQFDQSWVPHWDILDQQTLNASIDPSNGCTSKHESIVKA